MRIPDAYSAGFGKMVTPVTPVLMPDNSGAEQIGAAGMRLGNTLLNIATDQIQYQQNIKDVEARAAAAEQDRIAREAQAEAKRQEREAEQERKQLAREEAGSEAEKQFLSYGQYLQDAAGTIAKNTDLKSPEDKLAAFQETANEVRADFMTKLPDPLIRTRMDVHITRATMGARKVLDETLAKESADRIQANQVASLDIVTRSTRNLPEKLALIDQIDLSSYSQVDQTKIRDKARDGATETAIMERFQKEDPRKILAELSGRTEAGDPTSYPWLDQKTRVAMTGYATDRIKQMEHQRQIEAQQAAHLAEAKRKNAFDTIKEYVKEGYPIPADLDIKTRKSFQGTPYETMYQGLLDQSRSVGFRQELLNKDPLVYYARGKGINVPPLNDSQPLEQQLKARLPLATAAQQSLGLPFKPILSAAEFKGVAEMMKKQDGQGRVQTGQILGALYGKQGATHIAAQLTGGQGGDTRDGMLGLTVALAATGKTGAATLVANGADLLNGNKVYDATAKKLHADQFRKLAAKEWEGYMPQQRDMYQEAVTAAYTSLVRAQGDDPADLNKELYKKAFKAVVGETGYINGKTTVLPSGWTEDHMKNSMKQLSAETVTRFGGAFNTATGKVLAPAEAAKRIRTSGTLWDAGDNTYYVQLDGAQLMSTKQDHQGKLLPFRLRFDELPPKPVLSVPQRKAYDDAMDFGG